jgi:transposase-like protein
MIINSDKEKPDVPKEIEEKAEPEDITLCPDCRSPSVIHYGKRGKRVVKQLMRCKDCGRQFRKQEEAFAKLQMTHESYR